MKTEILSILTLTLFMAATARAQVSKELDSLGDQRAAARAAQLDSRSRVGVVQGRTVDLNSRLEGGVSFGGVAAGDSYINTMNLGAQLDYHITNRFSLGARYAHSMNSLTSEGQNRFNQAGDIYSVPQIIYPEDSLMGVVNWYMIYGKTNFFDIKTVQFDIYSLAGYGQIRTTTDYSAGGGTASQWNNTWTGGVGIALWLSQHLTSRFELRYQGYSDHVYTGERNLNLIVASFGIGLLI